MTSRMGGRGYPVGGVIYKRLQVHKGDSVVIMGAIGARDGFFGQSTKQVLLLLLSISNLFVIALSTPYDGGVHTECLLVQKGEESDTLGTTVFYSGTR